MGEPEQMFTVDEVAKILKLNPETIRRMLRRGEVKGKQFPPPRGPWRIPQSEVDRLQAV